MMRASGSGDRDVSESITSSLPESLHISIGFFGASVRFMDIDSRSRSQLVFWRGGKREFAGASDRGALWRNHEKQPKQSG